MAISAEQLAQFAAIKVELEDIPAPPTKHFKPLSKATIQALYSQVEGRTYYVSGTSYKPFYDQ